MRAAIWIPFTKKSYLISIDTKWTPYGITFQSRFSVVHFLLQINRRAGLVELEVTTPTKIYVEKFYFK